MWQAKEPAFGKASLLFATKEIWALPAAYYEIS